MYESPITLVAKKTAEQVAKQQDEMVFRAVQSVVPTVDKDELIRALKYDRGQYEKGYADGKRDAMDELVRCEDCEYFLEEGGVLEPWCDWHEARMIGRGGFCSEGNRKDGDGNG